ncbi:MULTISPECIES: hypothetical protein [Enterobacteriaceae]|uniref:Uncharacterized protein n=2 Tax=Enterobacteriaceae TaxID=543 RepID=H5V6Y9_ATLHE|nr:MULTISPECIES: hypothetical protein [Enterobacteriaceae]MBZ3800045.1 hypothetical protein [Leclercia adecarboxylata]MBZ3804264.1 hypothetical protein [Leclercia adecarboxylata]MDU7814190.1 hypothetical protein [Atlantibacter hermannii]MEC3904458.1 hypothetical protein [Leclercia adecarboxylata]MEC3936311.1 hypothetical protein [Leclercia adecarboxylata]
MAYKDFYHLLLESFSQPVELFTGSRNVPFILYAEEQKLFVRNGKDNTSRIDPKEVVAFVERFEESESLLAKDYQDVTFKASYLLAAMKYITEQHASVVRFHSEELYNSEAQYKDWVNANPEGYVLNLLKRSQISSALDPTNSTCLHSAGCSSVNNERSYSQSEPFTGNDYFKICSTNLCELEQEAIRVTKLSLVKRHSCIKSKVR